jgi:hypothetical protein
MYLTTAPGASLELEPEVVVAERTRVPDFRVRTEEEEDWTYVEVTAPDASEDEVRLNDMRRRLSELIDQTPASYAIDVVLRREPTEEEFAYLIQRIPELCRLDLVVEDELPNDLGKLLLNLSTPGVVQADNYHRVAGDVPYKAEMAVRQGPDEPHRHIAVIVAFSDERADSILRSEARQLPTDHPGLVMIALRGFRPWSPLIERRLNSGSHTRVSAVCLFGGNQVHVDGGGVWRPKTKLIQNPNARLALPESLRLRLAQFDADAPRA